MPSSRASIPLPNRVSRSNSVSAAFQPAFGAPVRWTLVVLSWLAFLGASYLAFHSVTGSSVAGCGMGDHNGCDVVLSSSWSKWLGVPVAVLGLACYAALASLSVLLFWRSAANHWITTAFVALAIVAAGASVWFIGVQAFAIGSFCKFCLVTDACGILLGVIAIAAAVRCYLIHRATPKTRTLQAGLIGMRPTTPTAPRTAPVATRITASPPSLLASFGGAVPLLALLIGGQLLFASKTYQVEQVALSENIKLDGSDDVQGVGDSSTATTRVALRVPSEEIGDAKAEPAAGVPAAEAASPKDVPPKGDAPAVESARERVVKFLNGKLSLNVYQHPLIGSPEAPHIVIEMVSYDCPHCRKMHAFMEDALARYGDQVALLVMPVPLDKDCNKLVTDEASSHPGACGMARYACGVAKLDPRSFVKFHNFLMTGEDKPPDMERIVPKAYSLVNRDELRAATRSPEIKKQLDGYIDLYGQLQSKSANSKSFGLPVQILGDQIMSGSVEKPEDVFKAWEQHLGVKPKG